MALRHIEEYRDVRTSEKIVSNLKRISRKPVRLMEVCGTHTMSIFRSGLRSLLPDTITLVSGPGCPVCVTSQREIDTLIEIAGRHDIIMTLFGDLMRVPGMDSSLQKERARGSDIRVVYSSFDALEIARENPHKKIIFPGIGFETTAPTIAASIIEARRMGLDNFHVYSAHKLVPPALFALMQSRNVRVDGFLLPGHVSVIIGVNGYNDFFEHHHIPCVIAGFEPMDILLGIYKLIEQIETHNLSLENGYRRAVTDVGNIKAQSVMHEVFRIKDTVWRGIGMIPKSGLGIKDDFGNFDAETMIDFDIPESREPKGCACGQILTGAMEPLECPLYKNPCSPLNPVGPCMVSSEGTCSAYYRYDDSQGLSRRSA